jgi:hypothetical protein
LIRDQLVGGSTKNLNTGLITANGRSTFYRIEPRPLKADLKLASYVLSFQVLARFAELGHGDHGKDRGHSQNEQHFDDGRAFLAGEYSVVHRSLRSSGRMAEWPAAARKGGLLSFIFLTQGQTQRQAMFANAQQRLASPFINKFQFKA